MSYCRLINTLQHLSDSEIVNLHKDIQYLTLTNVGSSDPTLCGTVSNALIKKLSNYPLKSFNNMDMLVYKILQDGDNTKKAYIVNFELPDAIFQDNPIFGGHSITIIKLRWDLYAVLQAYQYHYELRECNKYTQIYFSKKELLSILQKISAFTKIVKIPDTAYQAWKILTGVDISYLRSYDPYFDVYIYYSNIKSKL